MPTTRRSKHLQPIAITSLKVAFQLEPHRFKFDALADGAFIRESQLVQSPKRPGYPAPLPFSAPTLWRMVKAGKFPAPYKLSERVTAWRVGAVREWINSHSPNGPRPSVDGVDTDHFTKGAGDVV